MTSDEQPQLGCDDVPDRERDERDEGAEVEHVLAGQHERLGRDPPGQLEERDDRAGEGDRRR